ncbi:MAG: DNA topoisomerase IV subunit A [Rickettsiales bacterium]|jgi:topoisomerase-4 subunit A|nr:DNA topoisomerase IV subunit A [Rickettsiales bacterium]
MAENIKTQPLSEALSQRYLSYALSTIVSRSLPDVRDGLKPVHRRILYTMRQLRLNPAGGTKKSARVVGDVMGKYHPHGDASIYDAMVRLAQSFSVRYPLVVGQGNFGSLDGDSAAAMRYTEAKMSPAAVAMMEGLDEDAVDFMDTYSGEEKEPVVMPCAFPNLLANGASGIAVGMATSIPPHNVLELLDAALLLIKKPDVGTAGLCEIVKGPDFPTGGVVAEPLSNIIEAYETGRGGFSVLARWTKEDLPYSNYRIVVDEIPYQVQKSRLIERVAELMEAGKLPLVGDIRDESAGDVRIVIEPKSRSATPESVMAQLFANTEFQVRFPLNMNVLDAKCVPRVMGLKQALGEFIAHRVIVAERRAKFRISNIRHRLEILRGLLVAYMNLDEVIGIVRDADEPKPLLMERFGLSETQAESILDMRLRQLRRLEEMAIKAEAKALGAEEKSLAAMLSDDKAKLAKVAGEISAVRAVFAKDKNLSARRTRMDENAAPAPPKADVPSVQKDPVTVIVSKLGWIRAMKTHLPKDSDFAFKEGDSLACAFHADASDNIVFAAASGRFYSVEASRLPSGRGFGDVLRVLFALPANDDIVSVFAAKGGKVLLVSKNGMGFVANDAGLVSKAKNGRSVMAPADKDQLAAAIPLSPSDDCVCMVGTNRRMLCFALAEIPIMARSKGVALQRYKEPGTGLSDIAVFERKSGFSYIKGGKKHAVGDVSMWTGRRGGFGAMPPDGFPKNGKFA